MTVNNINEFIKEFEKLGKNDKNVYCNSIQFAI